MTSWVSVSLDMVSSLVGRRAAAGGGHERFLSRRYPVVSAITRWRCSQRGDNEITDWFDGPQPDSGLPAVAPSRVLAARAALAATMGLARLFHPPRSGELVLDASAPVTHRSGILMSPAAKSSLAESEVLVSLSTGS